MSNTSTTRPVGSPAVLVNASPLKCVGLTLERGGVTPLCDIPSHRNGTSRRLRAAVSLLLASLAVVLASGCHKAPAPWQPLPPPPVQDRRKVTLAAVGDVLLARGVGQYMAKHGAEYPLEKTKAAIADSGIAFFNLECPLSKRGVAQRRQFLFRADPALAKMVHAGGFDVACLANNHTLDYGRRAMMDTVEAVRKAGMTAVGAGKDRKDALQVRVVESNGLRVGFIAYTDLPSSGVVRLADRPTVAGVNTDEIPAQVKKAKEKCDVLAVSFHWGIKYMKRPTERQRKLAHLCIDNGADLILGHHPHVLQTVEVYKDRPIVYSMGGFVWDPKLKDTDKSAIYVFELRKSAAILTKTVPIRIVKCRPLLVQARKAGSRPSAPRSGPRAEPASKT